MKLSDATKLGKKEVELLFMFTEICHIEFDVTYHLVNLNVLLLVMLTFQPRSLPSSISRLVVACIYLPPRLSQDEIELAYDYLTSSYDKITAESPDSGFVINTSYGRC
jgi:hypothetical protein